MSETIKQSVEEMEAAEAEKQKTLSELEAKKTELTNTEEQKKQLDDKIVGMKSELERVQENLRRAREDSRMKEEQFSDKFRKEQFEKAASKFFAEHEYADDHKAALLDSYNKVKTDSIDSDKVYDDLLAAHVLLNRAKYVALEREERKRASGASNYAADQSSSASFNLGRQSGGEVSLTPEDYQAMKFNGMSEARYRELKQKGLVY